MDTVIQCEKLQHIYHQKTVLHDLSFSVARGGVFGLLGKNGAGKSTTINILMGFLRPSSGQCRVLGEASHALKPSTRARIGLLHEGFIQYDFMSIMELERYYSAFYPLWDRDIFFELINKLNLPQSRRIGFMSCGQRSQVVLGLIMAQKPELMLLDDYSMGLDVGYRRLFIDFLREYVNAFGTTVMLTSHVVQELDSIVDNMIVLQQGKVIVSSSKKDFMDTFTCYSFDRSEQADMLIKDDTIVNMEHLGNKTFIYSYANPDTIKNYLQNKGIIPSTIENIAMTFEDAFIGLTGKY